MFKPLMESEAEFDSQNKDQWEETINWMKDIGLIENELNVDDIFVNINE